MPNVGEILMTGSVDGTINLWNLSMGDWRSTREKSFNLEDKSRLLLTIDETRGCRKTK
jgi:WD40 repeat protein